MHPDFELPGIRQQNHNMITVENTCSDPVLLSTNQTNFIEQLHTITPITPNHFPLYHRHQRRRRLNHNLGSGLATGADVTSDFFPVNFNLGLSEICNTGMNISNTNNEGEEYALLHCWQNQEDSAIKQPTFWKPLLAEVSNENMDRHQQQLEIMNRKENTKSCLGESKSRVPFGELEAIYKRHANAKIVNETGPGEIFETPQTCNFPEELETSTSLKMTNKKRKNKKNEATFYEPLVDPMAQFFEGLVKQVLDHQESFYNKFREVFDRLDEERSKRGEVWRNQELAYFEKEAMERGQERALATSREATIVAFLEKFTGQKVNLPPTEANSID